MITGYGKDIVSIANTLSAIADETVLKNGHMVITAVYINSANDLEAIAYKSWNTAWDTGSEWVIGHGFKAQRDADGTLQVWWANGSCGFRSEADATGFLRGEVTKVWSEGSE